MLTFKDV